MNIANEIERIQTAKSDIKTTIEEKGVIVGDGRIDTYAEKIGEISSGGTDYLKYATTAKFNNLNLFESSTVELNISLVKDYSSMISDTVANTTVEHLIINGATNGIITTALSGFNANTTAKDTKLKRITFNCVFSKCARFDVMLANRNALEIIDGIPINFSSATTIGNFNSGNYFLKEIRVVEKTIKVSIAFSNTANLSDDSVQSIIDGLADLTGGTQQTLTFSSGVGSKLTDEQKAIITSKNWGLVY